MASIRAAAPRKPGAPAPLESSEAIGARLDEMERKIERLRALYESFFMGVERRPPQIPRQDLNRLMLETQQVSIRNAALRFRYQSLAQRWTLLTTYWNRTLREIEAGTYRRDLQKAYRRIAARGEALTEAEAMSMGIPAGRAKAFVDQQNRRWGTPKDATAATSGTDEAGATEPHSQPQPLPQPEAQPQAQSAVAATPAAARRDPPAAPPAPTAPAARGAPIAPTTPGAPPARIAPPPTPARAPAPTSNDVDVSALHRSYVEAHARLGLPGAPPTEERLREKLLPQLDRLRTTSPGSRLTATVVIENGRPVIRAKPRP